MGVRLRTSIPPQRPRLHLVRALYVLEKKHLESLEMISSFLVLIIYNNVNAAVPEKHIWETSSFFFKVLLTTALRCPVIMHVHKQHQSMRWAKNRMWSG